MAWGEYQNQLTGETGYRDWDTGEIVYGGPNPSGGNDNSMAALQAAIQQLTGNPAAIETLSGQGPFNYDYTGVALPPELGGGWMSPTNPLGSTSTLGVNLLDQLAMLAGRPNIQPQAAPGPVTYPFVSTGPQGVTPTQAQGLSGMYGQLPSNVPIRQPDQAEAIREYIQSIRNPMVPNLDFYKPAAPPPPSAMPQGAAGPQYTPGQMSYGAPGESGYGMGQGSGARTFGYGPTLPATGNIPGIRFAGLPRSQRFSPNGLPSQAAPMEYGR